MASRKRNPKVMCVMDCFLLALRDKLDETLTKRKLKVGQRYNYATHKAENTTLEKIEPTKTGFHMFVKKAHGGGGVYATSDAVRCLARWLADSVNSKELNEDARRWETRKRKIAARKGKDKNSGPAF